METENLNEELEIDLIDLLSYLRRKAWMILLGLLAGILFAGIYTFQIVNPMYAASSMIYMRGAGNTITSIQDLQIGAELTNDYEVIFTSRPILEEVIRELNLDMTYQDLQERIELTNPTDTRILRVELKDEDPKRASEIVNTLVQVGMDSVKEIDAKEPYLIEEAVADKEPVSPSKTKNLAMGALAGAFLVGAVLVIRYVANDRICGEDDVEKALGIPVFGSIPDNNSMSFRDHGKNRRKRIENMQAKIVLPSVELEYEAAEAVKTLRTNILYSEDVKTVMLTSTMPNEGKSTISLELAKSFAALGKNTILLDCDMRKSYLASRLGVSEKLQGVSEYLSKQSMKIVYRTSEPYLSMIFSGNCPPNPSELLSGARFEGLLETLKEAYDYIIIDAPPIGSPGGRNDHRKVRGRDASGNPK